MENIDPLQGGYVRRKYRQDRRPTLPVESLFVFYPRYLGNLIYKHVKMAQLAWHFWRFQKRLERDATARAYTDVALSPDFGHDADSFEMFTAHPAHPAEKTAAV